MSGHTKEPWEVRYGSSGKARTVTPILNWNSLSQKGHDAEANARLIAAAPDLLEALRFCVQNDGGECLGDHPAKLAQARAAIRKATGES
jgi:hypothetical protein